MSRTLFVNAVIRSGIDRALAQILIAEPNGQRHRLQSAAGIPCLVFHCVVEIAAKSIVIRTLSLMIRRSIHFSLTMLLAIVSPALVIGCSYQATLEPAQPYIANAGTSATTKVQTRVALVDDGRLENLKFSGGREMASFTLLVGPIIKQAYVKEMEAAFASVTTINKPSDNDKVDYYAFPVFVWLPLESSEVFSVVARLRIVERDTHKTVAEFQASTEANFHPSDKAVAAGLLSFSSGLILAPLTEPIKTQAVGVDAEKAARDAIGIVMHRLGDGIRSDQKLVATLSRASF